MIICDFRQFCANLTQDRFAIADAALKYTNPHQTAGIDISIHCVISNHVVDVNDIAFLPTTVDTADSLLNTHGIPGKIIINDCITELIVKAFGTHFCE